jgi:hypothetical protein
MLAPINADGLLRRAALANGRDAHAFDGKAREEMSIKLPRSYGRSGCVAQ